jgi:hypothetical protein
VLVDKTYTFTVKTTLTYIYIALVDDDTLSLWDLADISSYPGGGIDNWGEEAFLEVQSIKEPTT